MLIISKRQWNEIQENLEADYWSDVTEELREKWPDKDELKKSGWVREKANQAAQFGLNGRHSARRYCEISLSQGPGFPYSEPYRWAQNILKNKQKQSQKKLDEIEWTLVLENGDKS